MYDENERHLLRLVTLTSRCFPSSKSYYESAFESGFNSFAEVVDEHFMILVKVASSVYSFYSSCYCYQFRYELEMYDDIQTC